VTIHPESAPTGRPPASEFTMPLREIAALVLLGATAVFLFTGLLDLLVPYQFGASGRGFARRSAESFGGFVNLVTIGFPFLAVVLATHLRPEVARARLITLVALIEYAVCAAFGTVFGLLVGVVVLVDDSVRTAFQALLFRAAWLAVLGVAGFALIGLWQGRYHVAKPKPPAPPPGPYGQQPGYVPGYPQSQPGYPQGGGYGHPQQGSYGHPPGYPQGAAPGHPQPGHPQPGHPQPGYSQPGYPGGYHQPGTYPQQPPPQYAPPSGQQPGSADPTQPIGWSAGPPGPPPEEEGQRTQMINPASQQPSAGNPPPATGPPGANPHP